jgi:hypothetical protein
MEWPSIRDFLDVPSHLSGENIAIAVVDGYFSPHPDITTNNQRHVYLVKTSEADIKPQLFQRSEAPWRSNHGLMTAAAAAGSGSLASGYYTGAAPEADLYLLETGAFRTVEETEDKFVIALSWLLKNFRRYGIRGVVLTLAYTRDTGLLPWQADPIRVYCEKLATEGLLVVVASGNTKELTCSGPASSPSVLSVGGVIVPQNQDAIIPYHGCRGITFEGKRIPEILAPAENVVLPLPFQSTDEYENHYTAPFDKLPYGYARTEGTSYAAPIVLGCAACIWQANPEWTASQVELAMKMTAVYKDEWHGSVAGLVDVKAAATYPAKSFTKAHNQDNNDTAVLDERRLISSVLSQGNEISCCKTTDELKKLLINSPFPKVRAATLIKLAASSEITYNIMEVMLNDLNSYVRMAALFVLHNREDMWSEFSSKVIELFKDQDINIRYCAIKLASVMGCPSFIKPLISGLLDDAVQQRVSTFGARCEGLQLLTGIVYEPEPEFRDGQCFYSELSTQSRISVALKWHIKFNVNGYK